VEYNEGIENLAQQSYPQVALLKQIKGVGTLIALTFLLTLEDPHRFRKSRDVGCYLGLQPGRRNSGQSEPQMHIRKEGDPYLRTLLVQGAQHILGPFGVDCDLRRLGTEAGRAWWKKRQEASHRGDGEKAGGAAASFVGERRSVRTVAQQQANDSSGRRVKTKPFQEEKRQSQSRVPVTALMAWPRFNAPRAEPQGAKQIVAPAEPRTPNMHRAKRIAPRECGWKHGDSGYSAGE